MQTQEVAPSFPVEQERDAQLAEDEAREHGHKFFQKLKINLEALDAIDELQSKMKKVQLSSSSGEEEEEGDSLYEVDLETRLQRLEKRMDETLARLLDKMTQIETSIQLLMKMVRPLEDQAVMRKLNVDIPAEALELAHQGVVFLIIHSPNGEYLYGPQQNKWTVRETQKQVDAFMEDANSKYGYTTACVVRVKEC